MLSSDGILPRIRVVTNVVTGTFCCLHALKAVYWPPLVERSSQTDYMGRMAIDYSEGRPGGFGRIEIGGRRAYVNTPRFGSISLIDNKLLI